MSIFGQATGNTALFGSNQPASTGLFGSTASAPAAGVSPFSLSIQTASTTPNPKPGLTSSMSFASGAGAKAPLFGTAASAAASGSPFSFNTLTTPKTTVGSLFSSTNTSNAAFGGFKQPATANQQANFSLSGQAAPLVLQSQQNVNFNQNVEAFYSSLSQPLLMGDERDSVIAKWNQLQAMYGHGIGYCALGPVPYNPENPFCRFKSIAFNVIPATSDADGFVRLTIARPIKDLANQHQNIKDLLFRLLGNRPNIQIDLEDVRPSTGNKSETHSEVIIRCKDRQIATKPVIVSAAELVNHLSSQAIAMQLQSQMAAVDIAPEVAPSAAQLGAYFESPPAGFDKLVWQQFRLENPAPDSLLPVPLIGWAELKQRKIDQNAFATQQETTVKKLCQNAKEMCAKQMLMKQKIFQLKHKQVELSHRILKVLARQEVARRTGFAISPQEESLRFGLERIWGELLASPQGLRHRVQDLMHSYQQGAIPAALIDPSQGLGSSLDEGTLNELKEYLAQRTAGINEMRLVLSEISYKLQFMAQNPPDPNRLPPSFFKNNTNNLTSDASSNILSGTAKKQVSFM